MSEQRDNPYELAAHSLALAANVQVSKYRTTNSGIAYCRERKIEAPHPRGPVSFGTFAHEVGHVALCHGRHRPRWQEEVEAWEFALKALQDFGLNGYARLEEDAAKSLAITFTRALKRSPLLAAKIEETYPTWWALVQQRARLFA